MSMNLTITAHLNDLSIGISVPQTPTEVTYKILEQTNMKASFEVYREYIVSEFGEKDGNRSYNNLIKELNKYIKNGFTIKLGRFQCI